MAAKTAGKTTKTTKTAKSTKTTRKAEPATAAVVKDAPQRAAAKMPRRRSAATGPAPERVAELAYLLWEQGEPGDATEHWLRAESELRTAA